MEERRRRVLEEEAKAENEKVFRNTIFVKIIDVCSFSGAVWFFLTTILFGPLSKKLTQGENSIELENKRVYLAN